MNVSENPKTEKLDSQHTDEEIQCPIPDCCGSSFEDVSFITPHVISKSLGDKQAIRIKCILCEPLAPVGTNRSALTHHVRSHFTQSLPCPEDGCSYVARRSFDLQANAKTHLAKPIEAETQIRRVSSQSFMPCRRLCSYLCKIME